MSPARWDDDANDDDQWILDRCAGPTLDLGCGPGRLVVALAARHVPALGVDVSARAVARCRERGGPVLHGDALEPLPREGRWAHVVLADGNIGIGGDPERLLRRCRALLAAGGSIVVELDATGRTWRGLVRLDDTGASTERPSPEDSWFPWAVVGTEAVDEVAARAGLVVIDRSTPPDRRARRFAELTTP